MRYFLLAFLTFTLTACSTSEPDNTEQPEYENLTELRAPETQNYESSKVYIDSVSVIEQGLLISGNLPDGCSRLHKASHSMQGDSVKISITAWRPTNQMCTQALTPFSFIYQDITQQKLENATDITVNQN